MSASWSQVQRTIDDESQNIFESEIKTKGNQMKIETIALNIAKENLIFVWQKNYLNKLNKQHHLLVRKIKQNLFRHSENV